MTKGGGAPVGGGPPSGGHDHSQSSTLVFVEPSMVVVAFPSTAHCGAGVVGAGVNLPGMPRVWTVMVQRLQCAGGRVPSQKST